MDVQKLDYIDQLVSIINLDPNAAEILPDYHDRMLTKERLRRLIFKELKREDQPFPEIFFHLNERLDREDIFLMCDPKLSRVVSYKIVLKQVPPPTVVVKDILGTPAESMEISVVQPPKEVVIVQPPKEVVIVQPPKEVVIVQPPKDVIEEVPRRPYRSPSEQDVSPPKRQKVIDLRDEPDWDPRSDDSKAWVASFMTYNYAMRSKEYNFDDAYPNIAWGCIMFNENYYKNLTINDLDNLITKCFPRSRHTDMSIPRSQMLCLTVGKCVMEVESRGVEQTVLGKEVSKILPRVDVQLELCYYRRYLRMIMAWPHMIRSPVDPYILGKYHSHFHAAFYADKSLYTKWAGIPNVQLNTSQ